MKMLEIVVGNTSVLRLLTLINNVDFTRSILKNHALFAKFSQEQSVAILSGLFLPTEPR